MSKRKLKNGYWRRITYLVAGIAIGLTVMLLPALVHTIMGPASPLNRELADPFVYSSQTITNPLDVVFEFIWLTLPAIFVILAIYWIAGRRSRWSGYDNAVK